MKKVAPLPALKLRAEVHDQQPIAANAFFGISLQLVTVAGGAILGKQFCAGRCGAATWRQTTTIGRNREIFRQILVRQPFGLDHHMKRVGRTRSHLLQIVAFQNLQHLEDRRTLPIWR